MKRTRRDLNAKKRGSRKLNIVLVAAIAIVAIASFVAVKLMGLGSDTQGATAVITDADKKTYEMPLNKDAIITVTTDLGTNVIEIKDGRVRAEEADCPNQDCVHQGWIGKPGQQIVCLPHKLVAEVESDGSTTDDADDAPDVIVK